MSLQSDYQSIRKRLWNPPNAKPDAGITLRNGRPVRAPEPPGLSIVSSAVRCAAIPYSWQQWPFSLTGPAISISLESGSDLPARPVTLATIVRCVSDHFGVSVGDILSVRRTQNIVVPRQIAAYLAKTMTSRSLPDIGRRLSAGTNAGLSSQGRAR